MPRSTPRSTTGSLVLGASLVLTSLSLGAAVAGPASAVTPAPVPAGQSDAIADNYGVGLHMGYLASAYGSSDKVVAALTDLGVRHVRDDLTVGGPEEYAAMRKVGAAGIKFNLIMGRPTGPSWAAAPVSDFVSTLKSEVLPYTESVEGPNEWDNPAFNNGSSNWPAEVRTRQQQLYTAIKSDAATKHLPVLAPSMAWPQNYPALGNVGAYSDYSNAHAYAGGQDPVNPLNKTKPAVLGATGGKPLTVTESGYNNAVDTTDGHRPVPENVAATYYPRMLLDDIAYGSQRTYSYELVDEFAQPANTDVEQHFGLLRSDFSKKPAFTAMKTLLALTKDPGPSFTPGSLAYGLNGAGSDVQQKLVQKRNGDFVLLLWRNVSVWNLSTKSPIDVTPDQLSVDLGGPADVAVVDPTKGPTVQQSLTGASSVPLSLGGDVLALTIKPRTATPTPTTTTSTTTSSTTTSTAPTTTTSTTPTTTTSTAPTTTTSTAPTTSTPTTTTAPTTTSTSTAPTTTAPAPDTHPYNLQATAGDRQATLTWTSDASPSAYTLSGLPGGATASIDGTKRRWVVSGLKNGTRYTFGLVSADDARAAKATVSVTPAKAPSRPRLRSAYAVRRNWVTAVWSAPADNGRRIDRYRVYSYGHVRAMSPSATRAYMGRFPSRTVHIGVQAHNSRGWSPWAWSPGIRLG